MVHVWLLDVLWKKVIVFCLTLTQSNDVKHRENTESSNLNPQHRYQVLLVACVGHALRRAVLVPVAFVVAMSLEVLWLAGDGVSEFLTYSFFPGLLPLLG